MSDCGSSGGSPGFSVVITGGEYQFPSCLQFHFSFQSKPSHLGQWCTACSHSMELLQEQSTVRDTPSTSMPCSHKHLRAATTVLSGFCCWLATLYLASDTQAMMQLKYNLLKKWTNSRKLSSQPKIKFRVFSSLRSNWRWPSHSVFRILVSLEFNQIRSSLSSWTALYTKHMFPL